MPQAAKDAMMPTIPMRGWVHRRMWQRPWPSWPATRAAYVTGQVLAVDGGMAM